MVASSLSQQEAWSQFESLAVIKGLVDANRLADVVRRARKAKSSPFDLLVAEGHVAEGPLALVLGEALGIPVIEDDELRVETPMALELPRWFGVHHSMVPLRANNGSVEVAAANPFDMDARKRLKSLTGLNPVLRMATATQVRRAWATQYRTRDEIAVTGNLADSQGASRVLTRGQGIFLLGLLATVCLSAALWLEQTMIALIAITFAFFLISSLHKLNLAIRSIITSNEEG